MISHIDSESIFTRAADWISATMREPGSGCSPGIRHMLVALFGIGVCHATVAADATASALCVMASQVRTMVEERDGSFEPSEYDERLLLACQGVLSVTGHRAPSIDAYAAGLARKYAQMIDLSWRQSDIILLLRSLGHTELKLRLESPIERAPERDTALLLADSGHLRDVCREIESVTAYGTIPGRLAEPSRILLRDTLSTVVLHVLRSYDLELGSTILRAIRYLSLPATSHEGHASSFLIAQQRPDGRFGYYASDLACAPRRGDQGSHGADQADVDFDVELDLYLPITVTCTWSLAKNLVAPFPLITPGTHQPS